MGRRWGTSLKIKTDSTGTAVLQSLSGKGRFEINHCTESKSSIALTAYDFDYGSGGKTITIKLPARPNTYELKLVTPDGLVIPKAEQIAGRYTPSAWVAMSDYGVFKSDLGDTHLSSCGQAWTADGKMLVSPFSSSIASPYVYWEEQVTGGTIQKKVSVDTLSATAVNSLTYNSFRYISMEPKKYTVYQNQNVKVTGFYKGVSSVSELGNGSLMSSCRTALGSGPSGIVSQPDVNLKVTVSIPMYRPGDYSCVLWGSGRTNTGSFGFSVMVLPVKAFVVAESKKYKTCQLLNKAFEGGLAKSAKDTKADTTSTYSAAISSKGYGLNKALDTDKDGIACER